MGSYFLSGVDYGRPTYNGIKESLLAELNLYQEMSTADKGKWVGWILQAEEQITSLMNVGIMVRLRLKATYKYYKFIENPRITNIAWTNIFTVTTLVAHGLVAGDYVRICFNTGCDELFGELFSVQEVPTATTFTVLKVRRITGVTNATPMVVSVANHNYSGLASILISGVLGTTSANGIWWEPGYVGEGAYHVNSVPSQDSIELDTEVAGNGAYTSGGIVLFAGKTPVTSYVGGGSFYRETELPGFLKQIKRLRITDGGSQYDVKVGDTDSLTDLEVSDSEQVGGASLHTYPVRATVLRRDNGRMLEIYPAVTSDLDCDVFGLMHIDPQYYAGDDINCRIHLGSDHAALIREYVKSCMFSHMKKYAESAALLNSFYTMLGKRQTKEPNYTRMRITYR